MLGNSRPWSDDEDERLKQMLLAGALRGDVAQALYRFLERLTGHR